MRIPDEYEVPIYTFLIVIGVVSTIAKFLINRKANEDDGEWDKIQRELEDRKNNKNHDNKLDDK